MPDAVGVIRLEENGSKGRPAGRAAAGNQSAAKGRVNGAYRQGRPAGTYRLPIACPGTSANTIGDIMIRRLIGITALVAAMALPVVAQAQGLPGGVERGSRDGERAAGPVGAIVGGVIGGVVGGVAGVLGVDERPRFRSYVVEQRRPSYQYREDVRIGAVLPDDGVTYYDVPPEYGSARGYRYTVVNGRTVLVDPRSHRIVEVVE
jgi:hypothetical protein